MKKEKLIKPAADVLLLVSFAVFVYGLSLAYRPLGFIVGGLVAGGAALFVGYSVGSIRSRQ